MLCTSRLRLLADYLAATRNEIAVDEMFLRLAHLSPDAVGYLPRVPHWLRWAVRMPVLTRAIWSLGRILWLSGGAVAFFIVEFMKFDRLRRRQGQTSTQDFQHAEGAVLGFSTRVSDVLSPELTARMPKVWLTCPWTPQHAIPSGVKELPLIACISNSDLREAFFAAVSSTYVLARDVRHSNWALQSYTALRWFLVRLVLDRIGGTLVMTNHFDRWAVLVDRSIRAGRRRGVDGSRLVLVQHGTLSSMDTAPHGEELLKRLPTQLSCVDELYVYNSVEEAAFRRAVLATEFCRSTLIVRYLKPTIVLADECLADCPRLLFVGHPLCEDFQADLYRALRNSVRVFAYYKPHPKARMSPAMADVGWVVIDNPGEFPRVDLLISYPSTLVLEYESVGISASIHAIDASRDNLLCVYDRTLEILKSVAGSCNVVS